MTRNTVAQRGYDEVTERESEGLIGNLTLNCKKGKLQRWRGLKGRYLAWADQDGSQLPR